MARIEYVDLSKLSDAIKKQIDDYQVETYNTLIEVGDESIKFAKKEIRKDLINVQKGKGRKDGKRYRSTFTTRKDGDTKRILWNRQYPLSHLLENGHYVYNQYGGPYKIKKSKYGTTGDTTKNFKIWELTEREVAKHVIKELETKLK